MSATTIENINDGEFLAEADALFAQVQHQILEHGRRYGERVKGDRASFNVKVLIKLEDPEHGIVKVTARTESSLPAAPPYETLGLEEQDGEGTLFVGLARSGQRNYPGQTTLCDEQGQGTDPQTGRADPARTFKIGGQTG